MSKGYKQLTEKEFNLIKTMTSAGIPIKVIKEATNRSGGTLSFIKKADSFEDYRKQQREYIKKKEEKKTVKTVEKDLTTDVTIEKEMLDLLKDMQDIISEMQKQVTFIAEHTPVNKIKRWFE